jgi:hypothetical protein
MSRTFAALAMLGTLLAVPLGAAFAAGQPATSFQAAYKGGASLRTCDPVSCLFPGTGAGFATVLGQSSATYTVTLDRESPATAAPCQLASITATFGPNGGSQIVVSGSGKACPASATSALLLSYTYTVTGGTGRFSGASGSGTAIGVMDTTAGTLATKWSGFLSVPG